MNAFETATGESGEYNDLATEMAEQIIAFMPFQEFVDTFFPCSVQRPSDTRLECNTPIGQSGGRTSYDDDMSEDLVSDGSPLIQSV